MNIEEMKARGPQHATLRAEINRQGLFHPHERELLLEAADALLFDEPEAQLRKAEAMELLDAMEALERRTTGETGRLRAALEGCGAGLRAAA